jgi:NAD(P)-dependent dehydrogenase (short-subunit alcohol dehydrogenase family)
MDKWTTELIGPLLGKTALVTGGTEGVGLEVARELTRNGASVIICTEDVTKGERALKDIRQGMQGGRVTYEHVDFADLNSVKYFADRFLIEHEKLDLLINNAETSELPDKINSTQGYEMILAKNFLAPFTLTAKLFPLLENAGDGRVIFQSSPEHAQGVIDFFDLDATHYYEPKKAYAQSKLAVLILAKELDRRLQETHLSVKSIPVQISDIPLVIKILNLGRKPNLESQAFPLLYAATSSEAMSGHYYGGINQVIELDTPIQAKNIHAAEKLWDVAEQMCGIEFNLRNMSNVLPFQIRGNIVPELFT